MKLFVHPCVRVYMLGKSIESMCPYLAEVKRIKKLTLFTYMCIYKCVTVSMGLLFS